MVFGALALLLRRALGLRTGVGWSSRWAFALTPLYATSDELHQVFVPTRGPSVTDVAIDCQGGSTAP